MQVTQCDRCKVICDAVITVIIKKTARQYVKELCSKCGTSIEEYLNTDQQITKQQLTKPLG